MDEITGFNLLDDFRALVRREIAAALKRDGYHKRFEGAVSYSVDMPPVVDWAGMPDPLGRQPEMKQEHSLKLYCYVIGPARNYEWTADSASEVFAKATADFTKWAREDAAEEA